MFISTRNEQKKWFTSGGHWGLHFQMTSSTAQILNT